MLVSELEEALNQRNDSLVQVEMNQVSISDNATAITIGNQEYPLDERGEAALAKYLHIPPKYLSDCSPSFKATTLRYWADVYDEAETTFELVHGSIANVHPADELSIPVPEVGSLIGRVFDANDEATFYQDNTRLQIDVTTTKYEVEVLNPGGMPGRPAVGDITRGGVRTIIYPHQNKEPAVLDYLERLVCTNGMTRTERSGLIHIKGQNVEEIILEMEAAAHAVLGGLDEKLRLYEATSRMRVPGTPLAFAYQLGRELNFPNTVMHRVVALVNQLPQDASVYDVNQAFTAVANYDLPYATRMRLQSLGGSLAFNAEQITARCDTCEQLLT